MGVGVGVGVWVCGYVGVRVGVCVWGGGVCVCVCVVCVWSVLSGLAPVLARDAFCLFERACTARTLNLSVAMF